MNNVDNKFLCAEFKMDLEQIEILHRLIGISPYSVHFNIVLGNNDFVFFSAMPCGSKEGWVAHKIYEEELDKLVAFLDEHATSLEMKTVTTGGLIYA